MPKNKTLKQVFRNQRKRLANFTFNREENIADELKKKLSGKSLLVILVDIMLFIYFKYLTPSFCEYIARSDVFLIDGTFYCSS